MYRKSSVLFGLAEQRDLIAGGARLLVVEGPLDVLAVDQAQRGRRREVVAVAPCGTALTAGHVELLAAAGSPRLALAFDPDPAGIRALCRAQPLLTGWPSVVHVLSLSTDPADLLRGAGAAAARAGFLDQGRPLLDAVIEHRLRSWAPGLAAGWAEASIAALRAVAPLVASDRRPADFTRRVVALSAALALDPGTVTGEVLRHLSVDAAADDRGPAVPPAADAEA